MIDKPNRHDAKGFGKRGTVTMNRVASVAAVQAAMPDAAQAVSNGAPAIPKWAIGAVAGVVMLMLVSATGGIGGGGFLGGLLGGFLANKMMSSPKTPAPATAAAPRDAGVSQMRPASGSPDSVSRGGFGTTASSPSHAPGGHSIGG